MDDRQKLSFLQNMTHMALTHVATTPNVPTPDGKMSHEKKLAFVSAMAKHGLQNGIQHFDTGGTAVGGPTASGSGTTTTDAGISSMVPQTGTVVGDALPVVGAIGDVVAGINSSTQNTFQGTAPVTQAGTNASQLNSAYSGVQGGLGQQQNLVNQTSSGVGQGLNAQQTLSNQYAAEANGKGPNPAQSALNQQTGQNIQQQAALAAGQRGAGANAGLAARQNAQQGAATQQQAVGQGATLQAQQQLAAQNAQQALASTQVGQGATAVQNLNQQQQNEQNILQGANSSLNTANVAGQSNLNTVNAGVSEGNQTSASNMEGGLFNGIAGLLYKGGKVDSHIEHAKNIFYPKNVKRFDDGGNVDGDDTPAWQPTHSDVSNANPSNSGPAAQPAQSGWSSGGGGGGGGLGALAALAAKGGKINAPSSSQKAVVKGDSVKNDKIPALLSEGEVVIDRKTLADTGPIGKMARALAAHIQKRNGKK